MMKKNNLSYRMQQVFIGVVHVILLYWMFYALSNTGVMETKIVFYHFLGISIYGGCLIRGTAYWAKRHHLRQLKLKHDKKHQ